MVSYPPTDPPSDSKNMVSTNTDLSHVEKTDPHKSLSSSENKSKKTGRGNPKAKSVHISELPDVIPLGSIQIKPTLKNSVEGTQDKGLRGEELKAFYEKDVKEDEKSKAETARLLATT
ncbi:9186_t:CDS:1 [Funneliformis caledonium]|uniref:9186_t:CDS:1 n=1 Tax=Funneliformis caledonium TaxID=1117310 RepID=A0A9N9IPG8_9GLOM|nr:9186_t:CDS:1 [Funneliformis caledonium]